ncbi:YigZ family protein [Anaerococcus sp. AGMB09787]|uniref:YigZ family protein n=1 Tax=Anaerococcus sp. AGMB09787 TaxID=2922869 RepID=UPI001FAFBFAE|nr:YigZ family protein [Anaerococcus sp. AGMB09787]
MEIMSDDYRTIEGEKTSHFEENKSKFITTARHVESEAEALTFLEEMREIYKDATHNCYAYIINEVPEVKRYSDDGEPQGSAGLPMLSVLEKEKVKNIIVVVTRYFGGKLLGKGGLVRAYSRGVSDTLANNVVCKCQYFEVELIHSYSVLGQIENYLNNEGYTIIDKDYTDEVKERLYVKPAHFDKFKSDLIELTSANISINILEKTMLFES